MVAFPGLHRLQLLRLLLRQARRVPLNRTDGLDGFFWMERKDKMDSSEWIEWIQLDGADGTDCFRVDWWIRFG